MGFTRKRADAAVGRAAAEIDEEEAILEMLGQARAGIVRQARRAVGEVGDRRHDVGRLAGVVRVPDLLAVQRAAVGQVLVGHPPAAVAPFDDVDPAGLVAAVGVVVAGEEVAVVVERQLLRIAQAGGEHLQVRAIELAAQHRAGLRD